MSAEFIKYLTDRGVDLNSLNNEEKGQWSDRYDNFVLQQQRVLALRSSAMWTTDQHSSYARIWSSICLDEVSKDGGKLKFKDPNLNWPSETTELYERDVYKTMTVDIMQNKYSCVYVTGTSGIGKSLYLLYLMYELVRDSKNRNQPIPTILYKTRDTESFLMLPNGQVNKSAMPFPVFEDYVPNYVLIDSVDAQTVDSRFGPHILVASNTTYFKEFQKRVDEVGSRGKKFYMDLWPKDELEVISQYHMDILNLRYDIFGGSARNFKLE